MKFRYLTDPLFLATVILYVLNRYIFEPYIPCSFFTSYVNDLICIPFCVPIMLWMMRITRARRHDLPPTPSEIMIPLLIWSFAFELVFPNFGPFVGRTIADPNDILCYAIGACFAAFFWRHWYTSHQNDQNQGTRTIATIQSNRLSGAPILRKSVKR